MDGTARRAATAHLPPGDPVAAWSLLDRGVAGRRPLRGFEGGKSLSADLKSFRVERTVRVLEQVTVQAKTKAKAQELAEAMSRNRITQRVDVHLGKWRTDG